MEELELKSGIPIRVTPGMGNMITVQNTMKTTDDPLLVSTHGDTEMKWIEIEAGSTVSIDTGMYFLQNSWNTFIFPVIESVA